jgi:hypothetical protein
MSILQQQSTHVGVSPQMLSKCIKEDCAKGASVSVVGCRSSDNKNWQIWGLLYGTNLISPDSIFNY